jgi:serine/threonine protein kinase
MEPFPGYRLYQFLGRGSWGEVWKAFKPNGQPIALKFLTCDSTQAAAKEIRALQAIRQLHHPNLIRIEQVWCHLGYVIIGMELAEGSLADLLEVYRAEFGLAMVAEHVLHYLGPIAAALDFLNTRQHLVDGCRVALRHCDVKPSNLLLFGDTAKLADFSVATQSTSELWYHRRVGTLDYIAPEVFQGRLSERTDQYALAVTYCQLRGNRLPFHDTPTTFQQNYVRPRPDLSMLRPDERPIIARALAPVPLDRWPSCVELIHQLTLAMDLRKKQGPEKGGHRSPGATVRR